jgi:hypothetical protein
MAPVHSLSSFFLQIQFSSLFPFTPASSKHSVVRLSNHILFTFLFIPLRFTFPVHRILLELKTYTNSTRWSIIIIRLLLLSFSIHLHLRLHSFNTLFSNILNYMRHRYTHIPYHIFISIYIIWRGLCVFAYMGEAKTWFQLFDGNDGLQLTDAHLGRNLSCIIFVHVAFYAVHVL